MKRHTCHKTSALMALVVMGCTVATAFAQTTVLLNGAILRTAVPPVRMNGSTLVPMRDIFEALGAHVRYDNLTRGITARRAGTTVKLQIGNPMATVNELTITLSQAPILDDGSTLVPLRFVSESLGAHVDWDQARQLVSITQEPGSDMDHHHDHGMNPGDDHGGMNPGDHAPIVVPNDHPHDGDSGMHHGDNGIHPGDMHPAPPVVPQRPIIVEPRHEERQPVAVNEAYSIPGGVVVPVRLDTAISSGSARPGDVFVATVVSVEAGDSEFPAGTKIEGVVTRVSRRQGEDPGVLDIEFRSAILPGGMRCAIQGTPISLDNNSVLHGRGRITAKAGKDNTKRDVLIGAGAGFILGKITGKSAGATTLLGAAAGLLLGQSQKKGADVNLPAGTEMGVRLDAPATYSDSTGYSRRRHSYMGT